MVLYYWTGTLSGVQPISVAMHFEYSLGFLHFSISSEYYKNNTSYNKNEQKICRRHKNVFQKIKKFFVVDEKRNFLNFRINYFY